VRVQAWAVPEARFDVRRVEGFTDAGGFVFGRTLEQDVRTADERHRAKTSFEIDSTQAPPVLRGHVPEGRVFVRPSVETGETHRRVILR
jgi:hypothetical protein